MSKPGSMPSQQIRLGEAGGKPISIDLDLLLRTRLLVQANSGGGKSWVLRRLAEQLFGKVPVIIIDPEGEFATLREKFGYVLVGKGGETPADPRSAGLVAHKLLELRASAVCDIYEMKPSERHRWVRLFLEALIDAPKNLWRPTVVMVDEAHTFCPEKGSGESEASDAMTALPTRGRKRHFCAVWATQRLGKLRKDSSAELLNRLIGPTFEDVDLKRAADLLSIRSEDRRPFDAQMRVLEPGHFFALGRAICLERTMILIGPVSTSHEVDASEPGAAAPPAPEQVKKLLPQLADLPKQAEEKAHTEAELRGRIRELENQVRKAASAVPADTSVSEAQLKSEFLAGEIHRNQEWIKTCGKVRESLETSKRWMDDAMGRLEFQSKSEMPEQLGRGRAGIRTAGPASERVRAGDLVYKDQSGAVGKVRVVSSGPNPAASNGPVSGAARRIVDALAELHVLNISPAPREQVALMAGYTNLASKGFANAIGSLRSAGLIDYPLAGAIALTMDGEKAATWKDTPSTVEDHQRRLISMLGGAHARLLAALVEVYPKSMAREELAAAAGYTNLASKGFANSIGRLRSLKLIDYPQTGRVAAQPVLFLEAR